MNIGIAGPFLYSELAGLLDQRYRSMPDLPNGMGGTAVNLLVRGLVEGGHDVVLFTLDTGVTEEVILDGPNLRVCIGQYRPRARYRGLDFFWQERNYLKSAIQREQPDIVHAHWTYEFALGALASGVPTVITIRDWAPLIFRYYRNIYRLIRLVMDWQTFHKSKCLIANSPYIADLVLKKWKIKIPVIPNPIEDSFIRLDMREIPTEAKTIVAINSGMGARKNVESLIRAFQNIRLKLPDCRLLLIGSDFAPGEKAEKWAENQNLNEGIDYAGVKTREEIMVILDNAALLIHPSLEESFGNILVEAMARCVPVVAGNDSGAVPWVLDNGRAGILCDVNAPSSIASAAIGVLTSEVSWSEFSVSGNRRVREAFSLSSVVELTLEQYRRILKEESAPL